ncbi:L-threonylcarbamoyladenylate synthase [Algicola sagamiensis]|uniref:L-threonylcarbamoyladenylate synthase n=1 Tax=Algicola sagamiensis TaxID=163869 RepID=UPI00036FA9B3|nr:L-threonylcarbamoyladenylate synthase [Algicola sagamiensis]
MSQFFYIHPENPQGRLIKRAVETIESGGVIVYPTDSGYALGCQVGHKQAMSRIAQIRQIPEDHDFTLMVRDLSELSTYARVDNFYFRLLKANTPGAYTFIFKGTKEVPKRLLNPKKKTIGLRIPDNKITLELLELLQAPLLSTSLILPGEDVSESDPEDIRNQLERQVDLILHGGFLPDMPTTVVDMSEDEISILREGHGDPSLFES